MRPDSPTALLISSGNADHFAGVPGALAKHNLAVARELTTDAAGRPALPPNTRVVAVADTESPAARRALRLAAGAHLPVALLMDGLVEHRNTFHNPRSLADPRFLRPAPASRVLCATDTDATLLRALGNDAVATGLPRLAHLTPTPTPTLPRLLVATARTPAFNDAERERLVRTLARIEDAAAHLNVPITWRLTARLELDLGVTNDTAPLTEALERCTAVLTTPSTLALEARLAGRTTALIDPHAAPAWVRADAIWRPVPSPPRSNTPELRAAEDQIERDAPMRTFHGVGGLWRLVRTLTDTPGELHRGAPTHERAAANVADQIADLAESAKPAARAPAVYSAPCAPIARTDRPRVVNLYITDGEPLGGVPVWCDRMARAFADDPDLGYDVRTLVVSTRRWWQDADAVPPVEPGGPNASVCLVDAHDSPALAIETVAESLRRLTPDIVIPHYGDICHAAAAALRPGGVRTVAMMQTDDWIYRTTLETYDGWSAAVGGSAACAQWLRTRAGDRPVAAVRNGNPIAPAARTPAPTGPLRLAYVGRMAELQKRLSDLHFLADELDARGVDAELHLVGDGPDLDTFLARQRVRTREHVRLVAHGKRSPAWVTDFWSTMDLCVLVSENEGTAMVTLEAMSAGVVPAVTRTGSGAEDWITDGVNGIQVDIGDMARMAERIADLDRARLTQMAHVAWETARAHAGLDTAARDWADLLDRAMKRPIAAKPSDDACRLIEAHRWKDAHSSHPARDAAWATERLERAGYRSIGTDTPRPRDDAVVVTASPTPDLLDRIDAWRTEGLGVALAPNLIEPEWVRLASAMNRAHREGARFIAVYGCGDHTRRAARAFDWAQESRIEVVGLLDDEPRTQALFGLPVATLADAHRLRIDAIVLSSDAWEGALWANTAALRHRGVRVVPLYGVHDNPRPVRNQKAGRVA